VDINNPIPREWEDYVSQLPQGLEIVPGVLYSERNYIGSTSTRLTFFDFVNLARQDITNMDVPSTFPNPESMLIQNIRIYFKTPVQSDDSGLGNATPLVSRFNDLVNLVNNGILFLKIGNKTMKPWPLWTLPAHNFMKGSFSTGSDLLANYGQVDGMLYQLVPNLMISPLQQFLVTLEWPGGPVTLSTDTTEEHSELPIQVLFDGQMSRSIQ
jgi:hypothetical protein